MEHFTLSEAPVHQTRRLPVLPPKQVVGRDRELGQAYAQARAGAAVLLHGPSGGGKSALAATIAAAFTALPGGVLWWSVEADSLEQLLVRLGRAYGERTICDSHDPLQHLEAAAQLLRRDDRPLIVLDGSPDLDVARDFVRRVATGVPVILTHKEGAPGPWTPFPIAELSDEDAVTLFIHSAGYDQVSALVHADVRGVCNALGGLPLIITLAGRHVRVTEQTPGEFLGSLANPGLSGPQLGLRSIFHQLPEALLEMLLAMGATFAGRATLALLERLHPSAPEGVSQMMEMLVARGLVHRSPCQEPATCFYLHEMIHSFTQGWLHDIHRFEPAVARACEAIVGYAEQYAANPREGGAFLAVEMPNILGAASYAAREGDGQTLRRLLEALTEALGPTGGYGYELYRLEKLVAEVPAPAKGEEAAQRALFVEEAPAPGPEETPPPEELPEAGPVTMLSRPAGPDEVNYDTTPLEPVRRTTPVGPPPVRMSEEEAGEEVEEEAEAGPVEVDEAEGIEGLEAAYSGDIDDLLAASDRARAAGRMQEAASILSDLGRALLARGRVDEAREAFAEALSIYEDMDEVEGMLDALEALAGLSLDEGDLENAVIYATRAENLASQQGEDPAHHGHLLALLGDIRLELGEIDEAVSTYFSAIETLQATGDKLSLGVVQTKLGSACLDRGDFTQAITMLSEALTIFERAGRTDYLGRVLGNLGTAYGRMGQWEEAEKRHRQALEIARQLDDIEEQERQLANLAYIAQARGDREAMLACYRQALDLAYRAGEVVWQVHYLDVLGRVLMDDVSQVELAVMLLEEADALVPSDDRIRWLQRARKRLERVRTSGIPQEPLPGSVRQWAAGAPSAV